jgi:hypothetical protein
VKRVIATILLAIMTLGAPLKSASPVLVGVSPGPCDCNGNGSYSDSEYRDAYQLAAASGADIINYTIEWSAAETADGVYALTNVARIFEEANATRIGVQLTVVTISYDGTKKLPTYLSGNALDSAAVTTAFNELMAAIKALSGSNSLKVLLLGNEVEVYLAGHSSEITPFGTLIGSARDYVRAQSGWSGVHISASFKYTTASSYTTTYAAVASADTIAAFTYYPINGDFTVKYTNAETMTTSIFNDLNGIYTATGGAPMLLSEAGYPSSATLNSSEVLQSAFVQIMGALAQIIGPSLLYSVIIEWMYDWPTWLLDLVFPTPNNLREFVATLGYKTSTGVEKASFAGLQTAMLEQGRRNMGRRIRGEN